MDRFDLARLTDFDFEKVCKDIFEVELAIPLEIFAPGPDSGVDLRRLSPDGMSIIIQCKHWHRSGRAALVRHMESSEANKVAQLAPSRYLLATSVDLTPRAKDSIQRALHPHVQSPGDLWGVAELEAALGANDAIVRRHLRLWMSSAAVLEAMLSKEILLRSANLMSDIDDALLRYAPSPAFTEAQRILTQHKVCVISGIPGVGKTTLAQVLAAQEFVNGYEIVEISRDIDEALRVWDDDRLQLFYYDDFLGQTSLRDTVATNEDSRLIRFIRQIERAGNKLFILTTREYILAQAMQASEKLHTQALDVVKYLIDLESYSRLFRAEVLYNHIYFSKLPEANRAAFASEGVYSPIIRHRNFNPRLIALTLDAPETLTESPEESVRRVIANLDDPKALWDHMFKYQLSDEEVDLAELVFLSRLPMRLPELTTLWVNYSQRSARPRGGRQLTRTLASLEGTLLRVDRRDATIVVQLHNPSVRDYMRARLSEGYEHIDRALQGITEISQLETLWVTATGYEGSKILALLVERSDQFAERFLATIRYQDFSAWTGDWPTRVASYIEMAERLESHPISRAVAEIIENKRPEYVEDPGDYVQLFQAIRASRHAAIRNTEHSTLEWAIDDMEHDLHDWDVVSTVSATLSAIGGERADQESAKLAERLDDMARGEAERRAEERTSYVSESVAAEMLDHLSGYVNAEQEIYGYRELAHSVASARATREAQARAQDNQHRPQAPPSIPNEGEEAFIATMLGSLARIDG